MTSILIDNFGGEIPRADERLLPDNAAQIAINCDLRSGKIVPENEDAEVLSPIPEDTKTIYWRRVSDWSADWGEGFTSDWRYWSNLTYFFESPFAREQLNRLYMLEYEAEEIYHPMQYEGIGIPLQDLRFEGPDRALIATYVDRNNKETNTSDVITKGASETTTDEITGTTITSSTDMILCVGSANPSNSTINGDAVSFTYYVQKFYSTDNGGSWNLEQTDTEQYNGKTLYAGGTELYINPAIETTYTHAGATDVKVSVSASGSTITMKATGTSYPPVGEILDRYYMFTYVYEDGEESPPSPISNLATIYKGDVAALHDIGIDTIPFEGAVKKRIYTTSGGTMKVVGEIGITETTFTDDVATAGLYGEIQTANNPEDMHGMVLSPLGFTVGWNKRDILFANEFLPYAWNDSVTITAKSNIVGMITVNDIIYVLTEGAPYILSGFTIDSMSLEEIPEPKSCISRTGMVRYKNSAFYISPDGIVKLSGGSSDLYTRSIFDTETWESLHASTGALTIHDDILHLTTDVAHYRFSLAESMIVTRGEIRTNVTFQDMRYDDLYYKDGTAINKYQGDVAKKTSTWKSKEFDFKTDTVMSVGRVHADTYTDIVFNVYADEVLVSTTNVLNDKAFRLARTGRATYWSVEVISTDVISSIQLGQTMIELK